MKYIANQISKDREPRISDNSEKYALKVSSEQRMKPPRLEISAVQTPNANYVIEKSVDGIIGDIVGTVTSRNFLIGAATGLVISLILGAIIMTPRR